MPKLCPHCGKEINIGKLLGSVPSEKRKAQARLNGLKHVAKKK